MNLPPDQLAPRKGARSRRTILHAAAHLATIDGLDGLSIGSLASHIGMSKSGLYAHFGSKEELQLATVETANEIFAADVFEPTQAIDDPLEQLRALAAAFLDHVERRVFPGGCFFISVSAEFDTHPGAVKDRLLVFQAEWAERLEASDRRRAAAWAVECRGKSVSARLRAHVLHAHGEHGLRDARRSRVPPSSTGRHRQPPPASDPLTPEPSRVPDTLRQARPPRILTT